MVTTAPVCWETWIVSVPRRLPDEVWQGEENAIGETIGRPLIYG